VRFPWSAAQPALPDKPIAFKSRKVSADGIVGKVELSSQLVDSAGLAAEKRNYLPARTVEKAFIEGDSFHPAAILAHF
jgi:hypothetical protein